jgi:hypothetical protein
MKSSNDSLAIRFWTILAGFICVLGFAQMVLAQGAMDADSPLHQLRNATIGCGVSSAVLFLQANGCEKSIESLLSDAPTCEELSIADVAAFISKNGVSVVAVHMKANDFYHSCDTSAIAHLHPNGRSGHFSLMIPQQGMALAPVELDFGNLAIDSLEVPPVRGRTTLRTPPQDSITLEDFSVTALGEFKKL